MSPTTANPITSQPPVIGGLDVVQLNMSRAKEMFWRYACNHFFMAHDGVYEDYVKLGGANEADESLWRAEFIGNRLAKLSTEDFDPLYQLQSASAGEAIPALLKLENYGDDYSRFWYAFTLHELARSKSATKDGRKKALAKAEELWDGILKHPSGISDANRTKVGEFMLEHLKAGNAEEYIDNYTRTKLRELKGTTRHPTE